MRYMFVLDENVVICATTRRNISGDSDITCALLLETAIENCHGIVWSIETYARWSRQIQRERDANRAIDPTFMATLSQAMFIDGKCPYPESGDPPALPDEDGWNSKLHDDRAFLRLAAHFQCILATTDHSLVRDVNRLELGERHGFHLMSPIQALELARERFVV